MRAVVTTKSFIEKAQIVHGDKYDYHKVEYVNAKTKVVIICLEHGEFEQLPNNHLKYHCNKCGQATGALKEALTTDEFVEKARAVHGDKYNYTQVKYSKSKRKVTIVCTEHGEFKQTPSCHLQGKGCSKCRDAKLSTNPWSYSEWEKRGNLSSNFDSFKVYVIKCWDDNETFYKVGKTYVAVNTRFKNRTEMPYEWELINTYKGSALAMSKLEASIQEECKSYAYLPNISFGGKYECFSSMIGLETNE